MKPRRPKPGQIVTVWWLDSGAGGRGNFDRKPLSVQLYVKETHGRVMHMGTHATENGLPGWMEADTLILRVCGGKKDSCSELAAVWWPSVLKIKVRG